MSTSCNLHQTDGMGSCWPSPLVPTVTPPPGSVLNVLLSMTFTVSAHVTDNGAPDVALAPRLEVRSEPSGGGTLVYAGDPTIGAMVLPSGQTLYVRAQTAGVRYGYSPWSADVAIRT